tara:strand:- start:1005 stop:1820 length:816 start_codon:yes stop_codon:yes gene_type:complete
MSDNKTITKVANTEVSAYEGMEEYSGTGFAEVTTEDLSIPFLRILAQLSPQVNKQDGAYVAGAEAGMMFNTVLNEAYNGDEGIQVVPCHYNRRYVEWKQREQGGGYEGSYLPDDPIVNTTMKNERGQDVLPNGNLLTNTSQFFVLMLHPTFGAQRVLMTMSSTQLKKARKWLTQAQSMTSKGKNGIFVLPLMSQVYTVKTTPEKNDKGNWFGWDISRERGLDLSSAADKELFENAVGFAKSVEAGEVKVKEETSEDPKDVTPNMDDGKNIM